MQKGLLKWARPIFGGPQIYILYFLLKSNLIIYITVFTVDADNRILLTLRAPTKGMYPNYWEFTGGSGVSGEDSLASARRELLEETGIDCPCDRLILLGTLREPSAFMDCYLCRLDKAEGDVAITLQEGETVDSQWVTFCELETMIHRGQIPPPCAMRYGFVKARLTEVFGADAWLQTNEEAVSTLESTPKEASHE